MKPRSFDVRTVRANDEPVAHVLIFVTFVAHRKSNFGFPILTDEQGNATICWEDILQHMDAESKMFLMDYIPHPDNLTGELQFLLENARETERRIKKVKRFYPDSANTLRHLLASSMKFNGTTIIQQVVVDDAATTDPFPVRITVS